MRLESTLGLNLLVWLSQIIEVCSGLCQGGQKASWSFRSFRIASGDTAHPGSDRSSSAFSHQLLKAEALCANSMNRTSAYKEKKTIPSFPIKFISRKENRVKMTVFKYFQYQHAKRARTKTNGDHAIRWVDV